MLVFSLSLGSGTKRLNLQKIGANTGGKWGGGGGERAPLHFFDCKIMHIFPYFSLFPPLLLLLSIHPSPPHPLLSGSPPCSPPLTRNFELNLSKRTYIASKCVKHNFNRFIDFAIHSFSLSCRHQMLFCGCCTILQDFLAYKKNFTRRWKMF